MRSTTLNSVAYCALLACLVIMRGATARAEYISANISAVNLRGNGGLHTGSQKLHVSASSGIYGWTVTAKASHKDLVNTGNASYRINGISSSSPVGLSTNQWGYNVNTSSPTTFMKMPGGSGASAVTLFDVGDNSRGGCSSVTYCEKLIAFGANISKKQASGVYSTTVIYTITSKPKPYVPSYTPTPSYGSGSSSSSDSSSGSGYSSGSSNSGSSSGSGATHSSTDVASPEDPQRKYCREKYGSSGVLFDYCYKYMHVSKADTVCPSYASDYKKYRYCTSHDGDTSGYVEPSYPSYPSYPSTPDYGSGSSSGGDYDGGYDFSHPIRIQDPLDPNFPHP